MRAVSIAARAACTMTVMVALAGFSAGVARASFGIESFQEPFSEQNGSSATQAGSHPYSVTWTFTFNHHLTKEGSSSSAREYVVPDGNPQHLEFNLPAGLLVDLLGVPRCSEAELQQELCPAASQVGVTTINIALGKIGPLPVYNMEHAAGVPGELAFSVLEFVFHIVGKVRTGSDYGISAEISDLTQFASFDGSSLTLWGDPSAESHDAERQECVIGSSGLYTCRKGVAVERVERPFLTLPTSCAGRPSATMRAESWQEPGVWTPLLEAAPAPAPAIVGCGRLNFTPSIEAKPETAVADTPTGLSVLLKVPQPESTAGLAQANLKEAVVTLPAGVVVSPSTASGMGACSEQQIALASATQPSCPESSKIGSVEIVTPLLEHPLIGGVYVAQPNPQDAAEPARGSNPFGSLVALYIVAEGSGVVFKTAGEVQLNQSTGQLTARFGRDPSTGFYLPQVAFSELRMDFFGGPRAPLVPEVCGSYTTTSQLTPWSAPESGAPATPQSSFEMSSGCATGAFSPVLTAGTISNQAGGYSPFTVTFSRQDGEQELGAVQVRTPPGLLGSLAHIPLCGEPQASLGQCGAESQIGTVTAAVGPGPYPLYVTGGRAYLTGPYRGAPFGLAFVVPAQAGPFDLGDVVVRAAISIDPSTLALTITSDPLPTILQGIPLQVKSVSVDVNRPEFTFNPTNCAPATIAGTLQGSLGTVRQISLPFQAGDCAELQFKPRFTVSTTGSTSRVDGASLDAKVLYPAGSQGTEANFRSVKVELPRQLPSRLTTLQKACPAAVFEADAAGCPAASVIGIARALTPVLPVAVTGPVYFVSHGGEAFPSLVVVLQGDGVRVDLVAATFISKSGITSSTFKSIPDVPFSSFELYLPQGPDSALAASGSLCTGKLTMPTTFIAQNGAEIHESTKIAVRGCPKAAKTKKKPRKQAKKARKASHGHGGRRRGGR